MNVEEAERTYAHPKGHSKETLTECLKVLNAQPRRWKVILTLGQQVAIADAHDRLDTLVFTSRDGAIDAEYTVKDEVKLLK